MNERPINPTNDITARQRDAGDPKASAWVAANAGSGKTHVLTERVLRLLLSGVAPENLLCLTYTKAAAAEMRRRVSARLGKWAIAEEQTLRDELTKLMDQSPRAADMLRARTLFGHALETPGGLKINTIHAFAEAALHRFPLEAGVPFGFTVIEDNEQADLLRQARDEVLANGLADASGPVTVLFSRLSDSQIETAIETAMSRPASLQAVLDDPQKAAQRLRDLVGETGTETEEDLARRAVSETLVPPLHFPDIFAVAPPDLTKNRFEDKIAKLDPKSLTAADLFAAYLTADGRVPARFSQKKFKADFGTLSDRVLAEAERLCDLNQRLKKRRLIARSDALLAILSDIIARYDAKKRARSALDFNDLIARLGALLHNRPAREWVRYKLDTGITHILVDESQDTNPEQWLIIRALTDEFFAGDAVHHQERTIFAVGDLKQSIYSFQGAEPRQFADTGAQLRIKADQSNKLWRDLRLKASFRTLPVILDVVDKVAKNPVVAGALLSDDPADIAHESARADKGGSVTLWPPVRQEDIDLPEGRWPLDSDAVELRSAARKVAERIAASIQHWIATATPLGQRGRAVCVDDVLVLVQSRGTLFQEVIRALKKADLKSPGSDKLSVSTHIAVCDLLALGDILINPADDLTLAALLRSPLFDIDEDGLFALAAGRGKNVSLWQALSVSTAPAALEAYQTLHLWRSRLDFDRPFEFYANVLYAEGGLRRFHARLGPEVDDVLSEFLDIALAHERTAQPGLQGFLAAMRKSDISIKRELSEIGGGVRVMTVHGAKGLESPIVILADAATAPAPSKLSKPVYLLDAAPGPLLVLASSKEDHCPETEVIRDAAINNERAEYWRKLYVGMTRAEDALYITGMLTKNAKLEGTWYAAISEAIADDTAPVSIPEEEVEGARFPANAVAAKPVDTQINRERVGERKPLHLSPLPRPQEVEVIRPSQSGAHNDTFATAARTARDAETARKSGVVLHALLQHLSALPPDTWLDIGHRAATTLMPDADPATLVTTAISILNNPAFAELFGPKSRAEIPFRASAHKNGCRKVIAGRIDRLVVTETEVLAVDFKSDATPPQTLADVPASYRAQLGLYALVAAHLFPGHAVRAAILWTANDSLMTFSASDLAPATEGFTIG